MKMGKSLLEGISVYFYEKNVQSARNTTMCESLENSIHPSASLQSSVVTKPKI